MNPLLQSPIPALMAGLGIALLEGAARDGDSSPELPL